MQETAWPKERRPLTRIERTVAGIEPQLRKVIRALVTGELPWPLVLFGPPGTGKTCAALCLLDHTAGARPGEYYTVPDLCAKLIQSQQGRLEFSTNDGRGDTLWPEKFWSRIATASLVVLDELGCREKVSDAHYEAVKTIVDEREFKPFVVISNLSLAKIQEFYDARIHSRLAAGTVLELGGLDQRIEETVHDRNGSR